MFGTNMNTFDSALAAVFKYGMMPAEHLEGMRDGVAEGGAFDPNNTAAMVLADRLADYDDPREHIIRRDLEYRQHPQSYADGYFAHRAEHVGEPINSDGPNQHYKLKDGSSITHVVWKGADNKRMHSFAWSLTHGNAPEFEALFAPEEAKGILDKLGIEHNIQ